VSKQSTVRFPTLNERAKSVSFNAEQCATEFCVLRREFKKRGTSFRIFASPFEVHAEAVLEHFQAELINLQSREEIKSKFMNVGIYSEILQTLPS
jgi:hypothetical protein